MFEPKTKCVMYNCKDEIILGAYSQRLHYPSIYTIQHYEPLTHTVNFYNTPEIDFSTTSEGWGYSRALAFQSVWWQRKFVVLEVFLQQASQALPYYEKLQEIYGN
jgi:hypothetical protein